MPEAFPPFLILFNFVWVTLTSSLAVEPDANTNAALCLNSGHEKLYFQVGSMKNFGYIQDRG
jgi:hypothetical protein